jgi:hypothetical protein
MATRKDILNELESISPVVAKISFVNPYQVPQGYFDGISDQVMLRIKADNVSAKEELENLSPLLSSLSKKVPYEAPAGYFSELSEHAVAGVKAIEFVNVELENLSPTMNSLRSANVYEVPSGYFDSLAENVLKNIRERKSAKVVSMTFGKKVMRYAVAAAFTGLLALGGWLYFNSSKQISTASIENTVKQVSEDEMMKFLESDAVVVTESNSSNTEQMDETDMKSMLTDVSDEELEQFANDINDSNPIISN